MAHRAHRGCGPRWWSFFAPDESTHGGGRGHHGLLQDWRGNVRDRCLQPLSGSLLLLHPVLQRPLPPGGGGVVQE